MSDRSVALAVAPAYSRSRRPRLRWVDTTRGVSILLVVVLHTQDMLAQAGISAPAFLDSLNFALGSVRMPGFFVVSGLLARSLMDVRWPQLARRRVGLFAYLYVLWTAITAGVGAVLAIFSGAVPDALEQILWRGLTFDGVLWYLAALAAFYQVAWWCRRVPPWVQLAGAAVLSVVAGLGLVPLGSWGAQHTVMLYVYFLVGLLLPGLVHAMAARASLRWAASLTAVWAAAAAALTWAQVDGRWLVTVLPVVGVPMLITLCATLTPDRPTRDLRTGEARDRASDPDERAPGVPAPAHRPTRGLEWIGAHTLPLYVLHPLALSALLIPAHLLTATDLARTDLVVVLVVVAAIVTALSYGAWLLTRRWTWLYALPTLPRSEASPRGPA